MIDVLTKVAEEAGTTVGAGRAGLGRQRPGVASTIIGARTMDQLEDNLGALEVQLTAEQIQALNAGLSAQAEFPARFSAERAYRDSATTESTIDGQERQ